MTDKGCEQLFKKLLHRKAVVDADVFGHADASESGGVVGVFQCTVRFFICLCVLLCVKTNQKTSTV